MAFRLEYPMSVKSGPQRSFPASAFVAICVLALVPLSLAQSNNSASSSSGHAASAPSASAAGVSHASAPAISVVTTPSHTHTGGTVSGNNNGNGVVNKKPNPQQNGYGSVVIYPYLYGVAVPYSVDGSNAAADDDSDDDAQYQGGPTVFDRRGSGADSYVAPVDAPPAHAEVDDDAQEAQNVGPDATVPEPATAILVFKDGHQVEIQNYAIVGSTLYDLSSGRPRKIALADLDIPATEKLNDDRGVTFDLPLGQAN